MITLPYDPSPNIYKGRPDPIQCIVVHSTECPMEAPYARDLAAGWFHRSVGKDRTSAHAIFDPSGGVEMVKPQNTAWAVGAANQWTYSIEHCGRARFTRAQWLTDPGRAELTYAARWAAQIALAYKIPARTLTLDQMRAGEKGFVTHNQCRLVWGGTTHTDPGDGWPWDFYLQVVSDSMATSTTHVAGVGHKADGTYTVVAGDTLGEIAVQHGTTAEALAALNNIADPDVLDVGQVLKLSADTPPADTEEEDDDMKLFAFIVRRGSGYAVTDPWMQVSRGFSSYDDLVKWTNAFTKAGGKVYHPGLSKKQGDAIPDGSKR